MTKPLIENTLILVKPDGLARGLAAEILGRFERAGLKLVGAKLVVATRDQAERHYLYDDIATRNGEMVWRKLVGFFTDTPVLAAVFSGVGAIEVGRKLVGATEPRQALPGTIRGDFCHQSYAIADAAEKAVHNVVHASADAADAEREIAVWFTADELVDYRRNDEPQHWLT